MEMHRTFCTRTISLLSLFVIVSGIVVVQLWSNIVENGRNSFTLQMRQVLSSGSTESSTETTVESPVSRWAPVLLVLVVFLCMSIAYYLRLLKVKVVHESGVAIIIGAILGLIAVLISSEFKTHLGFNKEVFFLVLLPPIIFHAGYTMNIKMFFRNFGAINLFAIFGTLISTGTVSAGIWALGFSGLIHTLNPVESLLFGTLISAVDPVAVISIFTELRCDITLHSIVFGESVLNDAVVIVLFHIFQNLGTGFGVDAVFVFKVIGEFLGVFLGSLTIGIVIGGLSSLFFKYSHLKEHPALETAMVLILGYFPYLVAEAIHLSGIVALLFCGIMASHYSYFNLSTQSRHSTRHLFHTLALVAETFIFASLGLAIFAINGVEYKAGLICVAIALCLISRAIHVFPFTVLLNFKRKEPISMKNAVMLWWSGLRGAIAFALAMSVSGEQAPVIVSTTLVVVMFSVFILGGFTGRMVKLLKIRIENGDVLPEACKDPLPEKNPNPKDLTSVLSQNPSSIPVEYDAAVATEGIELKEVKAQSEENIHVKESAGIMAKLKLRIHEMFKNRDDIHKKQTVMKMMSKRLHSKPHVLEEKWCKFDTKFIKPFLTRLDHSSVLAAANRIKSKPKPKLPLGRTSSAHPGLTHRTPSQISMSGFPRNLSMLATGTYLGSSASLAGLNLEDSASVDGLYHPLDLSRIFGDNVMFNEESGLGTSRAHNPLFEFYETVSGVTPSINRMGSHSSQISILGHSNSGDLSTKDGDSVSGHHRSAMRSATSDIRLGDRATISPTVSIVDSRGNRSLANIVDYGAQARRNIPTGKIIKAQPPHAGIRENTKLGRGVASYRRATYADLQSLERAMIHMGTPPHPVESKKEPTS